MNLEYEASYFNHNGGSVPFLRKDERTGNE